MKPPSGNCSKIVHSFAHRDTYEENLRLQSNFKLKDNSLVLDFNISNRQIEVTLPEAHSSVVNKLLPSCTKIFEMSKSNHLPLVTGYFVEEKWRSLVCQSNVPNYSFRHIQTCLQNKVVYFIGDSTTKQFFRHLGNELSLIIAGEDATSVWAQPRVAFDKNNITIYFRAHGHPLQNPGPPHIRPFVSDTISTMVGGNNVFVVFNIGVHFYDINPKTFMHKLKYIRNAINDHHQKFPDTKFIIKGMNVLEPGNSKDWPLFRYDVLLKEYFRNINNAVFFNTREMTTVWPLHIDVHPPDKVLHQQYLLLLSYICE